MTVYNVNPARVRYVARLFAMSEEGLCAKASEDLQKQITVPELFGGKVKKAHLRRLMRFFGKPFGFWVTPGPTAEEAKRAVLYRKDDFSCELKYQDRLLVSDAESHALDLEAICELMDYSMKRRLPRCKASSDPARTAYRVRSAIGVRAGHATARKFLEHLVARLSEFNIIVNEHVENPNKKLKATMAGFFIKPHSIVFKRERQLSRSIFTLAHELGHYVLDKEEIDAPLFGQSLRGEELWCNDFAFHFILGEEGTAALARLSGREMDNPFGPVSDFAHRHHISRLAVYHHLARAGRISWEQYREKKRQIDKRWEQIRKEQKESPGFARAAKKIFSPLEKEIYIDAYFAGAVAEHELQRRYKGLKLPEILQGG